MFIMFGFRIVHLASAFIFEMLDTHTHTHTHTDVRFPNTLRKLQPVSESRRLQSSLFARGGDDFSACVYERVCVCVCVYVSVCVCPVWSRTSPSTDGLLLASTHSTNQHAPLDQSCLLHLRLPARLSGERRTHRHTHTQLGRGRRREGEREGEEERLREREQKSERERERERGGGCAGQTRSWKGSPVERREKMTHTFLTCVSVCACE